MTTSTAQAGSAPAIATVRAIIFGLMVAMFLAALDQTIVATALPTIGREIGNPEDLSWAITAYLLASTTVTPLYGKLADVYGRRATLMTAILIFTVGSVACALSPSMTFLAFARGLQGLGGGGLISTSQTIIADLIPPRERSRVQGYFATVFATASIAGPVMGGVMADYLHWSVIFWINLPLGALAWFMTGNSLRQLPRHDRPHRIDLLGAVLLVGASIPLLLALSWGGIRSPWSSPVIVWLMVASFVGWAVFAFRMVTAQEPFLPVMVVSNGVVTPALFTGFFASGVMIALTIYIPIYLQVGRGITASHSGLALIPLASGVVLGSASSAKIMAHWAHYKRPAEWGLGVATVALLILAVIPIRLPLSIALLMFGIVGIGIGSVYSLTTVSIQNAVMPQQTGIATAAMNFFRSLGAAIMVAGLGAIVLSGLGIHDAADISLDSASFADPQALAQLIHVFRWFFIATAIGLGLSLASLWRMEERPLRTQIAQAVAKAPPSRG